MLVSDFVISPGFGLFENLSQRTTGSGFLEEKQAEWKNHWFLPSQKLKDLGFSWKNQQRTRALLGWFFQYFSCKWWVIYQNQFSDFLRATAQGAKFIWSMKLLDLLIWNFCSYFLCRLIGFWYVCENFRGWIEIFKMDHYF